MKLLLHTLRVVPMALALVATSHAKDKPVSLSECPAPVQAVVKRYSAQYTFESIALDEKKKSGGTPVYEAKFAGADKKRFELHISPDGHVMDTEMKKPKN